jgi:hypothetical protein
MPEQDRLISLDVFRGITIAGMVLVNNPGSWSNIYWPLAHAEWHGWTPTALGRTVDAGGGAGYSLRCDLRLTAGKPYFL